MALSPMWPRSYWLSQSELDFKGTGELPGTTTVLKSAEKALKMSGRRAIVSMLFGTNPSLPSMKRISDSSSGRSSTLSGSIPGMIHRSPVALTEYGRIIRSISSPHRVFGLSCVLHELVANMLLGSSPLLRQSIVPRIIVFDVNETLLNVRHLEPFFEQVFGDRSSLKDWFATLLLHSEVATLAGPYFDFATLARAALQMTASARGLPLSKENEDQILTAMSSLPPHPEVPQALRSLRDAGLRLVTLTNSSQSVVDEQMRNAGLETYLERNFSVDTIRRYKPSPEPYRMVASALDVETGDLRLVAAHAWDIVGAMQAGCSAAFIARPGRILFPLTPPPDIVGPDLSVVTRQILDVELRRS